MRRWTTIILIATTIGLTVGLALHAMNPQKRNMELATQQIPKIKAKIDGDLRFGITMQPYTDKGGCLLIRGSVSTEADLAALHKIVDATSPPVTVLWKVDVDSPNTLPAAASR